MEFPESQIAALSIEGRLNYYKHAIARLTCEALAHGVVLTAETVPLKPLAMRNYTIQCCAREKR
jgi:hypothetical protein